MAAEMREEGKRFSGGTANFLGGRTEGFGGRGSVDDDAGKDSLAGARGRHKPALEEEV
ncbi:hypothetical protein AAF712_014996, partial [Marasmius tenuissimus]